MTNAREYSQHGHVFRPGPFHRRRAYWLDGAVLHWRIGSAEGHAQLADIASMRLYLPEGIETAARCVLGPIDIQDFHAESVLIHCGSDQLIRSAAHGKAVRAQ